MANEVNKQEMLQNAMSRAKKLIQLESTGALDKIAKGARDGISQSLDGSALTEQLLTVPRNRNTEAPRVDGGMGPNAMNVPSAIRESFSKNPNMGGTIYPTFQNDGSDLSFLTEGLNGNEEQTIKKPQRLNVQKEDVRQIISESMPQNYPQHSQSVDYPMIRTIVEEVVRKYAVSLNKKIINENKSNNEIGTITIGNKFRFLAKNGDLYEAKLVKVGNINDKKRSVNG